MTENEETWVEVTWCNCGHKFIEPWRERPHGLYANKIKCPKCKREFVVTHSLLRDREDNEGILEDLTHKGFQPRQTTLEEW